MRLLENNPAQGGNRSSALSHRAVVDYFPVTSCSRVLCRECVCVCVFMSNQHSAVIRPFNKLYTTRKKKKKNESKISEGMWYFYHLVSGCVASRHCRLCALQKFQDIEEDHLRKMKQLIKSYSQSLEDTHVQVGQVSPVTDDRLERDDFKPLLHGSARVCKCVCDFRLRFTRSSSRTLRTSASAA